MYNDPIDAFVDTLVTLNKRNHQMSDPKDIPINLDSQAEADQLNQQELDTLQEGQPTLSTEDQPEQAPITNPIPKPELVLPASSNSHIFRGIDLDTDVRPFIPHLQGWCAFIGRYSKNLTTEEYNEIKAHGFAVLMIWEAGANNFLKGESQGRQDAQRFLEQVNNLSIRPGPQTGVFPACDTDVTSSQLNAAVGYAYGFSDVVFQQGWQIGAYAPGAVLEACLSHGLRYPWSAGAKGWNATRSFDQTDKWVINQGPEIRYGGPWPLNSTDLLGVDPMAWPAIGTDYDPNVAWSLEWSA